MNSNYGESVKFYEKISQLHGQLKNYEEEQFTLEEEFERLWNHSSHPATNLTTTMTDTVAGSNVDKDVVVGESRQIRTTTLPATRGILKIDALGLEDKRRRRNQVILEKMKELEANASVFAARSEKLRIMRAEYEILVKKYMQGRQRNGSGVNSNLNNVSSIGHLLNNHNNGPLITNSMTATNRTVVSIGVNTNISGSIKPVDEGGKNVDFFVLPRDGGGALGNKNDFKVNQNELRYNYGHHQFPTVGLFSYGQGQQHFDNSSNEMGRIQDRDSGYTNVVRFPREGGGGGSKMNLDENEDSLANKLRHNAYFDLSTTSESDLTSAAAPGGGGGAQNLIKKKTMLPITINLDDTTTQSDTMSLSIQIPSKLAMNMNTNSNNQRRPSQLFNLSTTTDQSQSESMAPSSFHPQHSQVETSPNLIRQKGRMTGGGGSRMDPLAEDDILRDNDAGDGEENDKENENDDDVGIVSDSLTTSPGDSVMDSVQNRTLNDEASLPRGGGGDDNNFQLPTTTPKFTVPPALIFYGEEDTTKLTTTMKNQDDGRKEGEWETIGNISSVSVSRTRQPVASLSSTAMQNDDNNFKIDSNKKNSTANIIDYDKSTTMTNFLVSSGGVDGATAKFEMGNNNKFLHRQQENDETKKLLQQELDDYDDGWGERTTKLLSPEVGRVSEGRMIEGERREEATGKSGVDEEKKNEEETKEVHEGEGGGENNKKLVPSSISSSPPLLQRPKTAAAAVVASAPRRVRIKLDYEDTDSDEVEEEVRSGTQQAKGDNNRAASLKAFNSQGPPTTKASQGGVDATDDDDFDDFFDI